MTRPREVDDPRAESVQTVTPTRMDLPRELPDELRPYFAPSHTGTRFENPWPHPALPTLVGVARWKAGPNPLRSKGYRAVPVATAPDALATFEAERSADTPTRLFWIGHASFLLELDGARFVIDPIFGRAGGLVPRVTPPAATPAQLTGLSAVLVTHGHHDHFDKGALEALARENGEQTLFVVPRGLGASMPRACRRVVEIDWWEYVTVGGVRVHFVPAQHWHRRGMFDLNKGLWGGYVLTGTHRVYHSGDTGYFGGFRAIGRAFGGIDAACLPLGAYEPRWFMSAQHMAPEESVRALHELDATHFVGMHWGTYDLSDEPVDAGTQLVRTAAEAAALEASRLHVIAPGGSVAITGPRGATIARTRHPYQPEAV